ncbi:MAG TPA: SUMF1/EgtB/PvdO family nonheme iron enzyme [Myxococcota bacterium]|jgi:formylglycine-generating enzyme required for sulfatase activity|nr:SUMF1/EgtB/PvdO family nonheme iron enzyme [Myxococcota bacterium]
MSFRPRASPHAACLAAAAAAAVGASAARLAAVRPAEAATHARAGAHVRADVGLTGMTLVPAGWFTRGSNPDQAAAALALCAAEEKRAACDPDEVGDETPARRLWLPAFAVDRGEATFGAYAACVEAARCTPSHYATDLPEAAGSADPRFDRPNLPVVGVTWDDAAAYCAFVGKRLPTEAEWEKAARGPDGWVWPWGDDWEEGRANHGGGAEPAYDAADGFLFTAPPGSFARGASPYGAADLAGNVWEWVADFYERDYYAAAPTVSPRGPEGGFFKGVRGGAWTSAPSHTRAARRGYDDPSRRTADTGFRCARDAD